MARTSRRELPLTFDAWKKEVDLALLFGYGVESDDLPDCPYRDWYDDKVPPKSAAKRAYRNASE